MGTDNEFSLRHIEFEGLCGHPINSKLLAAGNSGLGLRRAVRATGLDLVELKLWELMSRETRRGGADTHNHTEGERWG